MEKIIKHYQEIAKYWEEMAYQERLKKEKAEKELEYYRDMAEAWELKTYETRMELNRERNKNHSSIFRIEI